MRLVITDNDLPFLKKLSYRISKYLNQALETEKAARRMAVAAIYKDLANMSESELMEHIEDLPDHLKDLFPKYAFTEDALYEFSILELPKSYGSTRVQVCIAKALGYKDWGELQAKAKHGHGNSASQFEELYGERMLIKFTSELISACELPEGVINHIDLRREIASNLEDIYSPSTLQFSSEKHCIVIGGDKHGICRILARRIKFAKNSGDQIVVLAAESNSYYVSQLHIDGTVIQQADIPDIPSFSGDVIIEAPFGRAAEVCKEILIARLAPSGDTIDHKPKRIHIVILDGMEMLEESHSFSLMFAQSRGLACSLSAGISSVSEYDVCKLEPYLSNAFDVICHPDIPVELKKQLNIDPQDNVIAHKSGMASNAIRRIKNIALGH